MSCLDTEFIYQASDFHLRPDEELFPRAKDFFSRASQDKAQVILDGDTLDAIIWGWKAYRNSQALASLDKYAPIGTLLIAGNHDRLVWLRKLFAKSKFKVKSSVELEGPDRRRWRFEHGDRFAVDWGPLRPLYFLISESSMKVSPKFWLWFCRRMGWVPSRYKVFTRLTPLTKYEQERQKYKKLIGVIWSRALEQAQTNDRDEGIGHTHTACLIKTAFATVADSGDMRDGSFIKIGKNGASLNWV